jgi:citrate synthase
VTGLNPLLEKKLYPNVDFYTGIIYEAMGFPAELFTVLFAIGRMPGWLAQWEEGLLDAEQKIARPRQLYIGAAEREYPPLDGRPRAGNDLFEPPDMPIVGD